MPQTPPAEHPNDIQEFNLDAIVGILQDEKLDYRIDEHDGEKVIRTGFINAAISFIQLDDSLTMEAMWRGAPSTDAAAQILAATNEWNLTQFTPTVRFFELGEDTLAINALRHVVISAGMSRNQVGSFVMSSIESAVQCFEWLEQQFPDLVTWKDEHHDH
ncbi:YbjN domain-containing protein [Corynebacterium crudilactis]|uniref:YbjN domain-containing protein n=1 Tax=Corynebacterium crudilactis TaxID=1652495 RepID=A0A172QTU8_9CORY|nr:YbjN domain-containing protein [Corynebacterium crudilactis]ANE04122.1 hypothetical protein ccrud_07805 [Corynebacterium crudilactis]